MYVVTRNGSGGSPYHASAYILQPGASTDSFVTAPLYISGKSVGGNVNALAPRRTIVGA